MFPGAGPRKAAKAREQAAARARQQAAAAERAPENDVVPWLRALGFSAREARDAAALCEGIPDAPLEERVRVALSHFRPRGTRVDRSGQRMATSPAGAASAGNGP